MKGMKRFITAIAALFALGFCASAQKYDAVHYTLPKTVIEVEIECVEQIYLTGPYARYAKEMLDMDTLPKDSTVFLIESIRLSARSEADTRERRSAELSPKAMESLCKLMEQGLVCDRTTSVDNARASVEFSCHRLVPRPEPLNSKRLRSQAKAAADEIKSLRENCYNIATGNTDASYAGEALGAALTELHAREAALLEKFGYSCTEKKHKAHFCIVPNRSSMVYEAFCFSPELGILPAGSPEGQPYNIEISAEAIKGLELAEEQPKNTVALSYRIPSQCVVKLCCYNHVLESIRVPIYQLGLEETVYILNK